MLKLWPIDATQIPPIVRTPPPPPLDASNDTSSIFGILRRDGGKKIIGGSVIGAALTFTGCKLGIDTRRKSGVLMRALVMPALRAYAAINVVSSWRM